MRSRILLLVGIGLLAMGAVFGTAAGVLAAGTAEFLASARPADGVVVGLDEDLSRDGDGRTRSVYHPVVAYEVGGQEHTVTGRTGTSPPAYDVGERVTVLYDPAAPDEARIKEGYAYWLETVFGLVALVLCAVGGVLVVLRSRAAARNRLARTGERATGTVTTVERAGKVVLNGRPRTATTVTWRHPFAGEQTFTELGWGAAHAVGDEVAVRYDADRPARAVLERVPDEHPA
ncbi:DUF3592 domain-containing protein [Promicromonospora sp. NPDC052451]|uniref:DUF3592 domain-containing protein n=1 Tax=Promicromonospora sp. NPDC052451 TaxID=3364407 RepID=UPI0037C5E271